MRIGAHVDPTDPLAEATARAADAVQFFLSDPQGWKAPQPRADAERLRTAAVDIYVHAPYVVNVATGNNRIRIPSRKLLLAHAKAAAAIGAKGLVVHGGHVSSGDDPAAGFDNWRKALAYAQESGGFGLPVLIENTAGGENACARRLDAIARLWDAVGDQQVGFCLDTCHAHAGGEELLGLVDRVKAITGRIDLIHANNSKDGFGSGRDRHDNLRGGTIDPELVVAVIRAAGAPVIVETPGGAAGQSGDIDFLRGQLGGGDVGAMRKGTTGGDRDSAGAVSEDRSDKSGDPDGDAGNGRAASQDGPKNATADSGTTTPADKTGGNGESETGEGGTTPAGKPEADKPKAGKPKAGKSEAGGSGADKSGPGAADKSEGGPGAAGKSAADKNETDKSEGGPGAAGKSAAGKSEADKDGAGKSEVGEDGAAADTVDKDKAGRWWRRWPGRRGSKADQAGSGGDKDPADDAEKDPWASFGPAPEPVPTWYGRTGRRIGRFLIHEWTLAALGSLALAVLMTWPTLRYARHTLPQDYWDPSLQAWQMAWSGHILLTDPSQLWHANAFFPERWSFAFSDTLLGYAPAGMIGIGPEAALVRYNIMFVLAHALATFGAYVLARQLGAGRVGSAVAGASYAYAPWLLAQAGHLHVISNGGIPLALAMLARGHGWSLRHGYRPERRHEGWVYTGWLVATWQLSLGFGIGLPFAYFLAGAVLVSVVVWYAKRIFRRVKRPFGQRLFAADVIGGLIFAGAGVLLAMPYFTVTHLHPQAERSIGDISVFSPPVSGFVTAPAESRIWGGLHEGARSLLPWHPEMTLLPGFVLYALAAGGLFFSIWKVRHRLLLLAGVLVTMTLSMGTEFFGGRFTYTPLFEYLPGWSGIRTPGRLMLWATLLLGLLAAGAVAAFAERVREISAERIPSWPSPWLRLATLVPLLLVIAEGTNTTPHPVVPRQPAAMRTVDGPLLVLPSGQNHDQPVMLWSTTRFQQIVNGGSGFTPRQLNDVRRVTMTFPDQVSVDYLRTLGVRNVLVLRNQIAGTPWEVSINAPVDALGITREEIGSVVVFRL